MMAQTMPGEVLERAGHGQPYYAVATNIGAYDPYRPLGRIHEVF